MTKQTMHRTAGDNAYLHQDFHGALSVGIDYVHDHYGEQAVRDYIATDPRPGPKPKGKSD